MGSSLRPSHEEAKGDQPNPSRCMRSMARRGRLMAAPSLGKNPRALTGRNIFPALAPYISFADHLSLRVACGRWRLYCRRLGRPSPPFPWLMLPEPASSGGSRGAAATTNAVRRRFCDIPGGRSYAYEVPVEALYRCVASAFGWLVLSAPELPPRLLLVNPITGGRMMVSWPFGNKFVDRFHAALTSSPVDRACFLIVVTDRLVAYCRPGQAWTTLRAPGFRYDPAASDIVAVDSMVYLVDDRWKLWRADLAVPEPKVERRNMAITLPFVGRVRLYLVESLRHVHLVLADENYKRVTVFRLDWDRKTWVPWGVQDDKVLLLGRGCSASVPASAAAHRSPGTVLFARQPSSLPDGAANGGRVGGQAWFWVESRVGAGPDDLLALKKTMPHRQGEFTTGDSFWFFPAIDPDERA